MYFFIERLITAFSIAAILSVVFPAIVRGQVNSKAIEEVMSGRQKIAKASWWGYDSTEATQALQSAINSGAQKVIVENMGAPWIVDEIQLASNQELFFGKGVFVIAKKGAFKGKGDSLLTARLKENVTLTGYGATLRMHKQDYDSAEYEKAEWRHILRFYSCSNVRISGLTLMESGGDGIYLGTGKRGVPNKDVHIKDVVCDSNYRQGISVISAENLLIENCILKNTSGTAPQAGIDFEPNRPDERLVNCVMRNCISENNNGDAYEFYLANMTSASEPVSIRLENCQSKGCRVSAVRCITRSDSSDSTKGSIEFVSCTFEGSERSGIIVSNVVSGCRIRFVNCGIANVALNLPEQSPITFTSRVGTSGNIGGVKFVNCVVKDAIDRPVITFQDRAGGLKIADVTGTITLERNGQSIVYQIDEKQLAEWIPQYPQSF